MKTYFIKTYGCYANIADSNEIAQILESLGYQKLKIPTFKNETEEISYVIKNSDLFVINTCSVRQKSEDKVYGLGQIFSKIKKKPIVVLAGCMVGSATGDRKRVNLRELTSKTPWVNMYINPDQIKQLPALLNLPYPSKGRDPSLRSGLAYVNISYGCDNFCSYCVVPYAREKEVSRSKSEVINEIKKLIKQGCGEFTLCGQNVNSWGLNKETKFKLRAGSKHKLPFAELLREVHGLDGVQKLGFMSSNPFDFTQDLIKVLKLPKMENYVHIAVQSGNNEILKKMNRRHIVEEYLDLVEKIREAKPDIEIGSDIIVGFPGETGDQFIDTVNLVKRIGFSVLFIAMYSPRKGTYAAENYEDSVSLKEKKRRHDYLMKVWKESKK